MRDPLQWAGLHQVVEPDPDAQAVPEPEPEEHTFDKVPRKARSDTKLSARSYRVLAAIEGHAWGESRECWACNRTLGHEAGGIGPEAVRRAIRQLEHLGYLRVEPDPSKMRGSKLCLLYQLRKPFVD
jgi:hypothetical protein